MGKLNIFALAITLLTLWIALSEARREKFKFHLNLPQSDQAQSSNLDARHPGHKQKTSKTTVNPDAYLEKFGYLSPPEIGESHDTSSRRKAIREFQRMAGIAETGRMDADTVYWMEQPRCGMPDRMPLDMNMSSSSTGAPDDFYVPGYMWQKNYLTWKVHRYSGDLSVDAQRRAMYNAFKYWSDVTPLTFSETSASSADIDILFASYEHGDGYGNSFDGEGGTLAHAFYPENGDTHFDDSEEWTEYTTRGTNLEIVAAHEFGHALGLGHSNVDGALMRPFYQGYDPNFKLGYDDIMGVQSLYGPNDRPEPTPRPTPQPTESPQNTPAPTTPPVGPDACTTRFDAVFQGSDGQIYVFKHKWMWKLHYWGMYPGYPVLTREVFEKAPTNIRAAAYSFRSGYTYMFKGLWVYKYAGGRKIHRRLIRASGYQSPQSAFMASDGKIYLLRDRYYWIFDESTQSVETGIKRRIQDKWPGLPANIEAAVRLNDGFIYVFKGQRYRKFDERTDSMVEGYPRQKAGPWMGPSCTSDGSYERK